MDHNSSDGDARAARLDRVLAATDFSPSAEHAVGRAAVLCKETGAALSLFHAVNLSGLEKLRRLVSGVPNGLEQRAANEQLEEISLLAQSLLERYGVRPDAQVGVGPAFAQIEKAASNLSTDLIVVGSHGWSSRIHPILGSTAARQVENSAFPVLVVKHAPGYNYRNVLVPVDFSVHSLPSLIMACAVAPSANIILMHAYGVAFEGKIRAARDVEDLLAPVLAAARKRVFEKLHGLSDAAGLAPHAARLLACHGTPLDQILEQERIRHCDLIVMGRQGEAPLLERLLVGSVTKQVLAMSRADVLVSSAA